MLRDLTCDEIVEVTGGALIDGPERVVASGEEIVRSVSTDTRTLEPGALFVAIRGEKQDGHAHAAEAMDRGASALMVDHTLHNAKVPEIVVVDTVHALGDVARHVRDAFTGPVVGVTGSVGKTTTKDMIAAVLETQFSVLKSAANHNNEIGVPQTIFQLTSGHTALILEMGMRGAGQIHRLAEIGAPTIGVVTNVGHSHIELLGSQEAIAAAKGELFELLPAEGGVAIYPVDDAFASALRSRFRGETVLTCGIDVPADVTATGLSQQADGWRCAVDTPWGRTKLFVPSPGRFNVMNALFAVAVGGHLGVPVDIAARALARWTPAAMRLETVRSAGGVVILSDAYNAAPDSMIGALETLKATQPTADGGKRIAVLGEMRELGTYAEEAHSLVGRAVAANGPDMLILVGPLTHRIAAAARVNGFSQDRIHYFETTDEARQAIPFVIQSGDAVLVKGSRALTMERIVEAIS